MPLALLLLTYLFIIVDGEDNNTSKSNFKEMRFRFLVETHIPITVSTPKSWQKECSTRTKLLDDNVQRYNMCSIIGRCIGRLKYDKLYTFLLADENNLEIPIFAGDEPFIILHMSYQLYGISSDISENIANHFIELVGSEIIGSDKWIYNRWLYAAGTALSTTVTSADYILEEESTLLDKLEEDNQRINSNNVDQTIVPIKRDEDDEWITIGITSCRRLSHFLDTMKHLQAALPSYSWGLESSPNTCNSDPKGNLIRRVIIVDDYSSESDRDIMLKTYPPQTAINPSPTHPCGRPSMEYIMKGRSPYDTTNYLQRGHAASLNILLQQVSSRYFLYLEDDWRAYSSPILMPRLEDSLKTIDKNSNKINNDGNYSYLEKAILASVRILNTGRDIDNGDISNDLFQSPIHQVLFNEQYSRVCAVGGVIKTASSSFDEEKYALAAECKASQLGRGGWKRNLTLHTHNNDNSIERSVHLPYSLHEFGVLNCNPHLMNAASEKNFDSEEELMSLKKYCRENRHDFGKWPGLSLNPGLSDLHSIRSLFLKESFDSRRVEHMQFQLFNETDKTFEHRFSIRAHAFGARMAYFGGLFFQHIGDISAYKLNEVQQRPWD